MSPVALSNEKRHGLRRPYAQISGQVVELLGPLEHSGPPLNGLPAGIVYVPPGCGEIRRIFPSSVVLCCAFISVSFPPPPSPTEMYRSSSGPNWSWPPLWLLWDGCGIVISTRSEAALA